MNGKIDKYTVQLRKLKSTIAIYIINEHGSIVEFYYTPFFPLFNKHCIFESLTELSTEILLYHNIIEQINNQKIHPKFMLTNSALISLL